MTFHAMSAYITYLLKAKNRHGVHSPFVYQFIEECLQQDSVSLIERIKKFVIPGEVILISDSPMLWEQRLNDDLELTKNDDVIVIKDIHQTKQHTGNWGKLVAHPKVQLSIDIYSAGFLFVKKEFKEKQHFIVKK